MDSDAHFERGRTHAVCQDYALCGRSRDGQPWVLVCDGCSSSPRSDVGARLLAHAAAAALDGGRLPGAASTWHRARTAAAVLAADPCCLDATVVAALDLGDRVVALIRGDGVVAARRRDGGCDVIVRRCADETPDYPSVVGDPPRRAAWCDRAGPLAWLDTLRDGCLHTREARGHVWVGSFARDRYDRLLVGTDGLASWRTDGDARMGAAEIAARMLDAPSTRGCFVQRRLARLARPGGPLGTAAPDDDVAVAALAWDRP